MTKKKKAKKRPSETCKVKLGYCQHELEILQEELNRADSDVRQLSDTIERQENYIVSCESGLAEYNEASGLQLIRWGIDRIRIQLKYKLLGL